MEVSNGVKNEGKAQAEFELALGKSKKVLASLTDKKNNLKQSITDTNESIENTQSDIEDLNGLLTDEKDYLAEIKPDCDWILGEFETRREKRGQEMEGLTEAKAMLSGAAPELLQRDSFLKQRKHA